MKRGFARKAWVYLLCVSFLLLASGFHTVVVEAREISRPLGDMLSTGDAMFESREGVWKNVEVFEFPIFPGVKIKTAKSPSQVTLRGNRQIDVGKDSFFSFDRNGQMELIRGRIEFRLPRTTELNFKVGELTVTSSPLRAPQNPVPVSPEGKATAGSISVHSNGAVTIKSHQGFLSVLNQERAVLAALSPKDTVTLPSVTVKSPPKVMVAKADGRTGDDDDENRGLLGVPWWIWEVGAAGGVMATILTLGVTTRSRHGSGGGPVCP